MPHEKSYSNRQCPSSRHAAFVRELKRSLWLAEEHLSYFGLSSFSLWQEEVENVLPECLTECFFIAVNLRNMLSGFSCLTVEEIEERLLTFELPSFDSTGDAANDEEIRLSAEGFVNVMLIVSDICSNV
jgi:hypothetical protein